MRIRLFTNTTMFRDMDIYLDRWVITSFSKSEVFTFPSLSNPIYFIFNHHTIPFAIPLSSTTPSKLDWYGIIQTLSTSNIPSLSKSISKLSNKDTSNTSIDCGNNWIIEGPPKIWSYQYVSKNPKEASLVTTYEVAYLCLRKLSSRASPKSNCSYRSVYLEGFGDSSRSNIRCYFVYRFFGLEWPPNILLVLGGFILTIWWILEFIFRLRGLCFWLRLYSLNLRVLPFYHNGFEEVI